MSNMASQLTLDYIEEHQLVARYLAEQLAGPECAAFERYIVEHPEMLSTLEATAQLKLALAQLLASGELAACRRASVSHRSQWLMALAASLLLAVGAAVWWANVPPPSPVLSSVVPMPTSVTGRYEVMRTRSRSHDATIILSAQSRIIELRVTPEIRVQAPRYRMSLAALNADRAIATLPILLADAGHGATVYLNSECLASGTYELTLSNEPSKPASPEQSIFLLQFVQPAPWKQARCRTDG